MILHVEHEYVIIGSELSITFRAILNELDNADLISNKLDYIHLSTSSSGLGI